MKWTNEEINLIKNISEKYPRKEILNKAIAMFPNRNPKTIRRKIKELIGPIYEQWTKEEKQIIIETYKQIPKRKINKVLKEKLPNKTKNAIYNKAFELGVTNQHWANEEINLVESWAGIYSLETIHKKLKNKGYNKTKNAIKSIFEKMKWSRKLDDYSCNEVAIGLGCPWKKVIDWIEKGFLKGKQKEKFKYYTIKPKEIALFIRNYPYEVNNFKPDIPWLVSLLDEFNKKGDNRNGTD